MSAEDFCEFFKSSKGKDILFKDGYSYNWKRTTKGKYTWVCECYKKYRCRAIVRTIIKDSTHLLIDNISLHSHEPELSRKVVALAKSSIKQSAKYTSDQPSSIIQNAIAAVPKSHSVDLPSHDALKQIIKRTRRNEKIPQQLTSGNVK